jgi:hypothetical protein
METGKPQVRDGNDLGQHRKQDYENSQKRIFACGVLPLAEPPVSTPSRRVSGDENGDALQ